MSSEKHTFAHFLAYITLRILSSHFLACELCKEKWASQIVIRYIRHRKYHRKNIPSHTFLRTVCAAFLSRRFCVAEMSSRIWRANFARKSGHRRLLLGMSCIVGVVGKTYLRTCFRRIFLMIKVDDLCGLRFAHFLRCTLHSRKLNIEKMRCGRLLRRS